MTPHIGVTQETIENINSSDTIIPNDVIKVINKIALDRLIDSRDTSREALAESKAAHAIVMTVHAHQVVLASEKDIQDGSTNIHGLTHPYMTGHVLDVEAQNTQMQIENILHR